jgi:thymidylate synthase
MVSRSPITPPPFYPRDLIPGHGYGVGLCTLWTPKSKYLAQQAHVEIIGNLYSRFGIGILIRNVLATPSIQTLVVTGVDNPEPRQRQAEALLQGGFDPAELFLEPWHIDEFYRRVTLHDARAISVKQQAELADFIQSLPQPAVDWHAPLVIPLPEVTQTVYPTARSGHLFRTSSIKDAHYAILNEIRRFGETTQPDNEGHRRQELWQVTVCLPPECTLDAVPLYEIDEIRRYGESLWRGDEPEELTYRYGHTLRHRYGDQVQVAIDTFRKKPETFRTVLTLWEPLHSMQRDDEPCLTTVHPRIRNGILDMYAYIRTNEMFRAWPKNAAGLRYFQEHLADELDVTLGELTITSGSAHIYDYDWSTVDSYLRTTKAPGLVFDPKGDWRFTREGDRFIAEHYLNGQLLQNFREPSIERLEKRILPFIYDVSHALYIGRELGKLHCLDE